MGHMAVDIMVGTGRIGMTRLDMEGSWILWITKMMDTGTILVLVLTDTMNVIVIILTIGVIGDIFQMSLRKLSHLLLMDI